MQLVCLSHKSRRFCAEFSVAFAVDSYESETKSPSRIILQPGIFFKVKMDSEHDR
jgi:hypothetical protein